MNKVDATGNRGLFHTQAKVAVLTFYDEGDSGVSSLDSWEHLRKTVVQREMCEKVLASGGNVSAALRASQGQTQGFTDGAKSSALSKYVCFSFDMRDHGNQRTVVTSKEQSSDPAPFLSSAKHNHS